MSMPAAQKLKLEIDKRLGPIARRIEEIRPALEEMKAYLESQYIEAFEVQGRATKWKPRSVPNTAGIIRDIESGGTIKPKRFDSFPALEDTGELKISAASDTEIRGKTILWGTNVPYAVDQHFGGEKTINSTIPDLLKSSSKDRIERELRKVERRGFKREAQGLRVRRSYTLNIPARPLVEFTPDDFDALESILIRHAKGEQL